MIIDFINPSIGDLTALAMSCKRVAACTRAKFVRRFLPPNLMNVQYAALTLMRRMFGIPDPVYSLSSPMLRKTRKAVSSRPGAFGPTP
jgi:hypothetical protein